MSKAFWVEKLMRIGTTEMGNAYIEVSPDGDGLGCVSVTCPTKEGEDWFGDINLTLDPDAARELGKALLFVADSIRPSHD